MTALAVGRGTPGELEKPMPADVQVRWTFRDDNDAIVAIGGYKRDGTEWKMTVDQAIAALDAEVPKYTFFTSTLDDECLHWVRAEVGVVHDDPPYLRTQRDGTWNDNLLAIPKKG